MGDWIVVPQPRERPALRLFVFPYAGGGTAPFAGWARRVPPHVEVATIRLPGRETRIGEAPYRRLEPLVEDLAAALAPALDVPFAFFGHSLGAIAAFELARHLRGTGGPLPVQLLVSARRAPQLPERDQTFSHLPDEAFVAEVVRRYDAVPRAILDDPDLLAFFLPLLRADVELLERYVYRGGDPLPVPLSALGGRDDTRVREDELAAWGAQTTGRFRVATFSGGHFYFREAEAAVVDLVVSELLRAAGPAGAALTGAR